MTKEELERIQSVGREWLRQPGVANGSRLTIPAGGAVSRTVELEVRSLLTFDNVTIASVVDADTGVCYSKLIARQGEPGEFIDTPLDLIPLGPASPVQEQPASLRATQKRYQDAMQRLADTHDGDANEAFRSASDTNAWWIEKGPSDADQQPKYLLYTNGELLGYSLLERARADGQRSGRFHPSEDYFSYASIFAALPQAENDCFEANAREAYGIVEAGSDEYRQRFSELSAQVDALQLYLEDEAGLRIKTAEVRLEDLSRHYDDQTERWLQVTLEANVAIEPRRSES
jgi:hypothetical protein